MTGTRPSGNRAFWSLIGAVVVVRLAISYAACCLSVVITHQVAAHGPGVLWSRTPNLVPGALLAVILVAGVVAGTVTLGRSGWRSVAFARDVRRRTADVPDRLADLTGPTGTLGLVDVVDSRAPFAATYGLIRPRIVVSDGLLRSLDDAALTAVLAHEAEHVRNRDPLRAMVATVLSGFHFYLPGLHALRAHHLRDRELAADRSAIGRSGHRPLATAILTVTDPVLAGAPAAAGMASAGLLEARVEQLETGAPPPTAVPRRTWLVRAIGVAGFGVLLIWSAAILAAFPPPCMLPLS